MPLNIWMNLLSELTDMFVKITGGTGTGQVRKITDYNGTSKTAGVDIIWDTVPDGTSVYKIDSSFYYIHYHRDDDNNVWRKVVTYCYPEDPVTCVQPETYVPWDATPLESLNEVFIVVDYKIRT